MALLYEALESGIVLHSIWQIAQEYQALWLMYLWPNAECIGLCAELIKVCHWFTPRLGRTRNNHPRH